MNKKSVRLSMLLAFGFLSLGASHAYAAETIAIVQQQNACKGVVKDANGEPVVGATVRIKNSNKGTICDNDGAFTLTGVKAGETITISCIGFTTQDVKWTGGELAVTLEETANDLGEAVVIGYGSVRKSDATGSIQAIKPDELNKGNRVSAQDALVGKVAGVNIVTNGGAPGDGATIRIRSGASLSASNDPLIVIDGVPVDNSTIEGAKNIIGSINPNDIETFSVLKDASATAIYGSRASNGVIVITTKKGADRIKVDYSANFAISQIAKTLDVLSAEEFKAFVPTVTGVPSNPDFGNANTDWVKEVTQTAFSTDQNVAVSGKIKKIDTPFRVSVGYNDQNGIIRNSNYQRTTFGGNIAPSFFDNHLTATLNLKVSNENNRQVSGSVFSSALNYDPTRSPMTGSSTAATDPGLGYFIWENGGAPMAIQPNNPVSTLELENNRNKVLRSIGSANLVYKVHGFEDLKANVNLGYDILRSKYSSVTPDLAGTMYTDFKKDGTGQNYNSTHKKKNYLLDAYLNYDHTWNKVHQFGIMGGYGWQHFWNSYDYTNQTTAGEDFSTPFSSESEYYLVSFYGRANYSYADRYLITATMRTDASSRFSSNNRWGLFPSVALAWRVSQEEFFKEQNVLSDLKIRASYGVTGQQDILNDYPYMGTFTYGQPESSYRLGNTWYRTYRPNAYDPDIKWESTATWNGGIDFGFIGNRIYGSIDYYKRYTDNLLNTIDVISGTNFSSIVTTNIGKMENKGLEISLNAVPVKTRDWNWTVGLNFTWSDSKITKLNVIESETNYVTTGAISGTGKYVQVFMVDERPYTFYLAEQAYDNNGKPLEGQFIQKDGSVGTTEYRRATGKSALPKYYLGFNTQLSYKNWDLAINGHGSFGQYVYNYVRADQYKQGVYSDQGYYANILRSTMESGFELQQLYTDYWLEKGDFFKFDNITLGYTFDHLWNNTSSLRLTAGVSNVATITKYTGVDPEIENGIDRNKYPRPRTYNIGVNLTF